MNIHIEKIKNHIQDHKVAYACGATAVLTAGITYLVVRSNAAQGGAGGGNAQGGLTNTASRSFLIKSPQTIIKTINVLERDGRGHPGYPIRNLETKHIEFSQKAMADYFGISEGLLSGHLNGKFPDVDGLHFERVNFVPEGV